METITNVMKAYSSVKGCWALLANAARPELRGLGFASCDERPRGWVPDFEVYRDSGLNLNPKP